MAVPAVPRARRLLSSHRRRRRLARLAALALVAGVLAVIGVRYANTGTHGDLSPARPGAPQLVPPPPRAVPLRAGDARAVRLVARRFVATAVLRRHVVDSWPLVAPSLREGLSRRQWATGAIPVVPYPASDLQNVRWTLSYSYRERVGLRLYFQPRPGARSRPQLFDVELTSSGPAAHRRWLVSSWTPASQSTLASLLPPGSTPAPAELPRARLGWAWLVGVVGALVGAIALVPVLLGVRGWLRSRRASRAYRPSL